MIRIYIDCVGANRPLLSGLLSLQLEQACAPGRVRASAAFCKALLPPDAWLGFGLEEGGTTTALSPQPQAASLGLRDADSEVAWWPSVESESGDSEGSAAAGNDPGRSLRSPVAHSSWTGPERPRPGRQASYVSTSLLKLKRSAFSGRDSLEAPPVASASDAARSCSENGSVGSFVARPADPGRPSVAFAFAEGGSGGGAGGGGPGRSQNSRSFSASLIASGPHHASFDGTLPPHPRSSFVEATPSALPLTSVVPVQLLPKFAIDAAGPLTLAGVGPSDTFYIELLPL